MSPSTRPGLKHPSKEAWRKNKLFAKIHQYTFLGLLLRYAISFAAVVVAMGLRLMLEAWGGTGLPTYITFYPAVMSVSLLAGFGPGLLATVLAGLVSSYFILLPVGHFFVTSTIDRVGLVFFFGMGLFMSLIAELYRRNLEKLAALEAQQQSEEQFRTLADAIPQLCWMANADGSIFWYNQRYYDYTGAVPEQTEGWGWQSVLDLSELPKVLERWQASIATGDPFEMTFQLRGADGVFRQFLTRIIPLKDSSGRVQRWFGTNTDVSELKRVEEELQKSRANLEQNVAERTEELARTVIHLQKEIVERHQAETTLSKETTERLLALEALREKEQMLIQQSRLAAMGEMIGNIAHQWRQPLNLLGLTTQQLLLYYDMGEIDRKFLAENVEGSMKLIYHMSKTIDDFRNFFKPDKEKSRFKVQQAITDTLTLLEGSLHTPPIKVEIVANDDPVIDGYANEFAQAILNLVINAKDVFIEREISDAKLTITVSSENGCAVVTVADNAGGVPEEIIDKIFEPYFTTKRPQGGTGVGLFMSKTIIEKNMGGKLAVRNKDNGAEFRIEVCN